MSTTQQTPARTSKRLFTKKNILIALALALIVALWYLFLYEPQYSGPVVPSSRTLVFGHRGFGYYAPDNSLAGGKLALANGLDGIDMDGQLSSDGTLVIFHDLSVDRLTNGSGKVNQNTLATLRALDLGPKYNESFRGSYVATFEDFVTTVNGSAILMVELKVPGVANTGIEEQAISIIKRHHAQSWVYLSSFNPLVLYRVKQLDPSIHTVLIFMDTNWNPQLLAEIAPGDKVDLPWALRQEFIRRAIRKIVKPDLLSVNYEVAPTTRAELLAKGWPIFLWVPETNDTIAAALAQHPYGIISDEPLLVQKRRDSEVS